MSFLWKIVLSCKSELKIILVTFAVLFTLPIFAVVVIANAGITEVAQALASVNPITHQIEVKDANGNVIRVMDASTVWPVRGYISEEFGVPHMPWQPHHTGIDIANPWGRTGDPVTTFMAGRVIAVNHDTASYGNHVIIDHGGIVTSLYGHLSETLVSENQEVKPGDVIGLEGSTGASTGPHVHFEIRVFGVPVNPHTFMATPRPER